MISAKEYSPVLFDKNIDWERLRKGTSVYHRFWTEQYERCINGYHPHGGSWIPGNYYFYLNFCMISAFDKKIKRKRPLPPLYRDQDHEYFVEANKAKEEGYGLIVLKARRKGFSFHECEYFTSRLDLLSWCRKWNGSPKRTLCI
ncbi:MAG: hypothetical protein KAS32_00460 [Candidatus Peribacteraceae bacterium]|nr:hypothetical protein [Candidatus Peribacteraceae bacterium]